MCVCDSQPVSRWRVVHTVSFSCSVCFVLNVFHQYSSRGSEELGGAGGWGGDGDGRGMGSGVGGGGRNSTETRWSLLTWITSDWPVRIWAQINTGVWWCHWGQSDAAETQRFTVTRWWTVSLVFTFLWIRCETLNPKSLFTVHWMINVNDKNVRLQQLKRFLLIW